MNKKKGRASSGVALVTEAEKKSGAEKRPGYHGLALLIELLRERGPCDLDGVDVGDGVFAMRLGCGRLVPVDADLVPVLSQAVWWISVRGVEAIVGGRLVLLHRVVMDAGAEQVVVARNNELTDCRRANLLAVPVAEARAAAARLACPWSSRENEVGVSVWPVRDGEKMRVVARRMVRGRRLSFSRVVRPEDAREAMLAAARWRIYGMEGGAL